MNHMLKLVGTAILLLPVAAQTADSYSYGVEREMKESGEKGGTADINIGVGELQETKPNQGMLRGGTDKQTGGTAGKTPSKMKLDDIDSRRDTY